jgi:hypothetical protein
MVVSRYSTTGEPGIKTKFDFFVAGNGTGHDIGMNTYVYIILHSISMISIIAPTEELN